MGIYAADRITSYILKEDFRFSMSFFVGQAERKLGCNLAIQVTGSLLGDYLDLAVENLSIIFCSCFSLFSLVFVL